MFLQKTLKASLSLISILLEKFSILPVCCFASLKMCLLAFIRHEAKDDLTYPYCYDGVIWPHARPSMGT